MSQRTFADTLIQLESFKRIFVFCPKIDFFQGVSAWFLAENEQLLKSAFFTCLCPQGFRRVVKLPWEPKTCLRGRVFGHTVWIGSFKKNMFFVQKSTFFEVGIFHYGSQSAQGSKSPHLLGGASSWCRGQLRLKVGWRHSNDS